MAIASDIPGLQVTINVNGEALQEYDYEADDADQDPAQPTVRKYIVAPDGAEFEIGTLYKEPFSPPFQLHADIMMDGNYVNAPFMEWGGKEDCEGYKYRKATFIDEDGVHVTRNFQFAELKPEENMGPVTAEQKRQVSSMGQIVIYMYYVEGLEEANPANIPQARKEEDKVVSHKALKEAILRGEILDYQTTLSAPEQHDGITYSEVKTQNEPFATFTFYYRSEAALKSLGLIARTPCPSPPPSPSPEPERNIDQMTEEEVRDELRKLREQQNEHAVRIKREREEREDSVATMRGDDEDDDVKFVEERTAERVAKRARHIPGPGNEVLEVDSE